MYVEFIYSNHFSKKLFYFSKIVKVNTISKVLVSVHDTYFCTIQLLDKITVQFEKLITFKSESGQFLVTNLKMTFQFTNVRITCTN